jgi:hypothetical protein
MSVAITGARKNALAEETGKGLTEILVSDECEGFFPIILI